MEKELKFPIKPHKTKVKDSFGHYLSKGDLVVFPETRRIKKYGGLQLGWITDFEYRYYDRKRNSYFEVCVIIQPVTGGDVYYKSAIWPGLFRPYCRDVMLIPNVKVNHDSQVLGTDFLGREIHNNDFVIINSGVKAGLTIGRACNFHWDSFDVKTSSVFLRNIPTNVVDVHNLLLRADVNEEDLAHYLLKT